MLYRKVNIKIISVLLISFKMSACVSLYHEEASVETVTLDDITSGASRVMAGDPGLTNQQYAERLYKDGWPVDSLNTAANIDFLSDVEKNIVLAHNLVRFDPGNYAELYVAEYISYYRFASFNYPGMNAVFFTLEGINLAIDLYRELKTINPLPLLYPSKKLSEAARNHARYQMKTGQIGHGGRGGTIARVESMGIWDRVVVENISYGNWSGHDAVLALLIDDGVPDRGHRKNILLEDIKAIGVGQSVHPMFRGGVYVMKYTGGFEDVRLEY